MLILGGCFSQSISEKDENPARFRYSVQLGTNKGGITENTNMADLPGTEIDAFSGATRTGFNVAGRVSYPFRRVSFETGLDYMYNQQTFTWNDPALNFAGTQQFSTHQLILPTTLNLGFFRKNDSRGLIRLKAGHVLQYNMVIAGKKTGATPNYSLNPFSNGLTFGISVMPLKLSNGSRMGLFMEGYRGSQIYIDPYNSKDFEMPGSSFMKIGIIYELQ